MDNNERLPPEAIRIVALIAGAIINGGRSSVATDTTLEMAKKFEKYIREGK